MARPKMPEGLYVSVSQIKAYLMCPRKYELHYIRGEPPAFVPVALVFGSAIHAALAGYYGELKATRQPLRRDLMFDVFRDSWEKGTSGPVPLQSDEEDDDAGTDQIVDKGVSMLHVFYEHAGKIAGGLDVVAVEKSFAVPLRDLETGEVLEEQLVGTIDLIVDEDGQRVIVEHKTSSRRYTQEQLRCDGQLTAYRLAAREMCMGEVGLRYQVLTKTKVPAIQVADVHRDDQDEDDFLRTVGGVLRAIDAGVSYPLRGWQCRTCPWAGPCGLRRGSS